jgi:hypothetical protein
MIVQLGASRGLRVMAIAGPSSTARVIRYGAATVLDRRDPAWPAHARRASIDGEGPGHAITAAKGGELDVLSALRSKRPRNVSTLSGLLGTGEVTIQLGREYLLIELAAALASATSGTAGGAVILPMT